MSTGAAVLTFTSAYAGVSHAVRMAPGAKMRRANGFVVESVGYVWECQSKMKANRLVLSKTLGGRKRACAKYAQRWAPFKGWGGVLVVDEAEVDPMVAAVTCCIMLLKMQQRAMEMVD
jgi:hypothetical protein